MKKIIYALCFLLLVIAGLGFAIVPNVPVEELASKYADADSKFISLDGMRIHYKDQGQGNVVLLLHGTGASLQTWDVWADLLSQHYRVIRLDLPAFGLTGPNPQRDYSLTNYVKTLNNFLTALDIKEVSLAGNSLGGAIAWRYTVDHPQQVESLILIDAAGFPRDPAKIPALFKMGKTPVIKDLMQVISPRAMFEKNLKEVYYDDSKVTPALVERYRDLMLREGNRQAMVDRINTPYIDEHEKIALINAPTLIMWGQYDDWIEPADAELFAKAIKNSTLKIYSAGHVPMEELPNETAADALQFLQTH